MESSPTRVIVTGSRSWYCPELAIEVVRRLSLKFGAALVVVHGDCPTGVDKFIDKACRLQGVCVAPCKADWTKYRKAAGPIRNRAMVDLGAVLCVAIHSDLRGSKGTKDCVRQAMTAGIPCVLVSDDRCVPRPIKGVD